MLITHLFDHNQGSRYHLMINHGLMASSLVGFIASRDNVISLGKIIGPKTTDNLQMLLENSDLIFRASYSHFRDPKIDEVMDRKGLWHKTIYYDFSDTDRVDQTPYEQCRLYVKRVPTIHPVHYCDYCLMPEYFPPIGLNRSLNVVYLFNPRRDAYNEQMRYQVGQMLMTYDLPKPSIIGATTLSKGDNGRRAIFEPFKPPNPFWRYINTLGTSRVVWTCAPDHLGGDSRLWEAFGSGALVVTGESARRYGFIDNEHCIMYNTSTIGRAVGKVQAMLKDGSWVDMAKCGQDYAVKNHKPVDRVDAILRKARER